MTATPEGFIPYVYRQRDPTIVPVLTSLVEIGFDPNTPAEERQKAINILADETFPARHGVYGHTVQAARMMLEEMADDIEALNNPLQLPDGLTIIDP